MTKIDSTKNLSGRKVLEFPHCMFLIRLPRSIFCRNGKKKQKIQIIFKFFSETGKCSWHCTPQQLSAHLKRINHGLLNETSEAETTDDETSSPRGRRRRNRRYYYTYFLNYTMLQKLSKCEVNASI